MNSWNREDACGSAQTDYGADPIAANVIQAARENRNFRTAFWTGRRLQMTLMEIPVLPVCGRSCFYTGRNLA